MKNVKFLLVWFVFFPLIGWAQPTQNNNSEKNKSVVTPDYQKDYSLPPLDTLIAWALVKNASLKVQDAYIAVKEQERELKSREWYEAFYLNGTGAYGNNQLYDVQQSQQTITPIVTTRQSLVYNAGVTVRLSMGEFVNRSRKINLKRLEVERAKTEKLVIIDQIREEVIIRYYKLLLALRMIKLETENLEAKKMGVEIAEKYFKEGNMPAMEYSTILNTKITIEKQLEQARFDAQFSYRLLREYVGF